MSSSQDRQLPATEQKLRQARQDGQVSRSRDLAHLAVLGSGAVAVMVLMPVVFDRLKLALSRQLVFNATTLQDPANMLHQLRDLSLVGLLAALAFAVIVGATAMLSTVAAGGWVSSLKPVMPDFNRINPLAGLGRLFSKQQLANVSKLCLLTCILALVSWSYLRSSVQRVASLVLQPSTMAMQDLGNWLVTGVSLLLLVVFAAAVLDVPLQAFFHRSRLKMSHQEVKQEHKNSEGSPEVKNKLRQRQREVSQRRSISNVPKADFVLMNPTHYAVALKYDEKTMGAPQVIAKGADLLAMRIREVAKSHDVPVLQSPMLARALYAHAELDQAIPSALYAAVAQVLAYVYRMKAALRGQGAMPTAEPRPEPLVPPEMDPHHKPAHAAAPATSSPAAPVESLSSTSRIDR
ncbi:flagellar biosynthesis protein FlhB [Xylophilus sp. GW821-FHT01B05]